MGLYPNITGSDFMRMFDIAIAHSRKAKRWQNKSYTLEELHELISKTYKTSETAAEYAAMSKAERDDIKDVGGFVGGFLKDGKRKKGACDRRSLLTLDVDNADKNLINKKFGYRCWICSTHSYTEENPRYRLIIPLLRDVNGDEYIFLANKIMNSLGIKQFDPTCSEPERLMYWCSHPRDVEPVFKSIEGELLDPDKILGSNWKDAWNKPLVNKQADPREKNSIVGAFCRTYTITEAIGAFLGDVYRPENNGRYTYIHGHSSGGLVIYDDDVFAYSNHATDPAGGKLLNAFDLVRVHKFGELDDEVKENTPIGRMPSYLAMIDFTLKDEKVKLLMGKEQLLKAKEAFNDDEDLKWVKDLERDKKGWCTVTAKNLDLIFNNDPNLVGLVYDDLFTHRFTLAHETPWIRSDDKFWTDADAAELRGYLDTTYGISHRDKIKDAFLRASKKNQKHPVREYLGGLKWDGIPRIDTLLVDYLGAEDSKYTRAITRKFLCGAVARVFEPGCKFDYMLVTTGKKGIGKTMLPAKLAGKWFSNSLITMVGKEAFEALDGAWIMEVGELVATRKADIETVKVFLTKTEDRFRRAYGEHMSYMPRQTVFWGTTNEDVFLFDQTGNRRFWVVSCAGGAVDKIRNIDEDTRGQIWAEAVVYYHAGEQLYLDDELETVAESVQEQHTDDNEFIGAIEAFVEKPITDNWYTLSIEERLADWGEGTCRRDKICVAEIEVEMLKKNLGSLTNIQRAKIRSALNSLPGWSKYGVLHFGGIYNKQRAWVRNSGKYFDEFW